MKDFAITPKLLRTVAGQTGFDHFRLTEQHVVASVIRGRQPETVMPQPLGTISNIQGFLDWCAANDVEVDDWSATPQSDPESLPPAVRTQIPVLSPPKLRFVAVINMRTDDPGRVYRSRSEAAPHIRGIDSAKHAEFALESQALAWLKDRKRERGQFFQLLGAASAGIATELRKPLDERDQARLEHDIDVPTERDRR